MNKAFVKTVCSSAAGFMGKHSLKIALGIYGIIAMNCVTNGIRLKRITKKIEKELDVIQPDIVPQINMEVMPTPKHIIILKRELTEEELDEIERRIYFNGEDQLEILQEKGLIEREERSL